MDFTGKFENLADDFKEVVSKLGFSEQSLKHKNKGLLHNSLPRGIKKIIDNPELLFKLNFSKNKSKSLSKKSIEIIYKYYEKDFKNFDYQI